AMQFICASLGVRCDHCHAENAFDKDDKKPKQTARQMIQMVMALNQNSFQSKREVSCYSCHRGSLRPATIPAVTTERTMPKQTNPADRSFALSRCHACCFSTGQRRRGCAAED